MNVINPKLHKTRSQTKLLFSFSS